jgi:hypothetical protein
MTAEMGFVAEFSFIYTNFRRIPFALRELHGKKVYIRTANFGIARMNRTKFCKLHARGKHNNRVCLKAESSSRISEIKIAPQLFLNTSGR